tara:strand:- start:29 stop:199 length:171 start_codon:yes stop_codon:yes gene_type:complete
MEYDDDAKAAVEMDKLPGSERVHRYINLMSWAITSSDVQRMLDWIEDNKHQMEKIT